MVDITPIPLSGLTTLGVGGTPQRMLDATTREELVASLREVWSTGEEWFVLGGGSNLLVEDGEIDASVVRILTEGIQEIPASREGYVRLAVEAGQNWDDLVAYSVDRGLSGIEGMSGIPGTAGAAPIQNVGAYGQEIVDTLVDVELLDFPSGKVSTVPASELELGFRSSVLKNHYGSVARRSAVVLALTIELQEVGTAPHRIASERLRTAVNLAEEDELSLAELRARVLSIRASKGMVSDENDRDTHSAGSFFKNPILSAADAASLPPGCPRWPLADHESSDLVIPLDQYYGISPRPARALPDVKVSAAWLIENSGLRKGYALPGSRASLSTKHTLAITNRGGASSDDVAELARFVQGRVHSEYGVLLEPEPVFVGVEL